MSPIILDQNDNNMADDVFQDDYQDWFGKWVGAQ